MPFKWKHETYEAFMGCISKYVRDEIFEALRELRARGGKSAGYPQDGYVLIEKKADAKCFEKPIKSLKIHFCETNDELQKFITHHLFMICELATEELYRA